MNSQTITPEFTQKSKQGAYYDQWENSSEYYENGHVVASLNFDNDEFENHTNNEMSDDEIEFYCEEMDKDREEFKNL